MSAPVRPSAKFPPIGRYVEDWTPGEVVRTPGRTITDADLRWYATWMGASRPSAALEPAHLMMATQALIQRAGIVEGTGVSNLGSTWTFHRPVPAGTTIWVRMECVSARRSRTTPVHGIVRLLLTVDDENDEILATADWTVMVLSREEA